MRTLKRINGIYIASCDGKKFCFTTLKNALTFIQMANNRNG